MTSSSSLPRRVTARTEEVGKRIASFLGAALRGARFDVSASEELGPNDVVIDIREGMKASRILFSPEVGEHLGLSVAGCAVDDRWVEVSDADRGRRVGAVHAGDIRSLQGMPLGWRPNLLASLKDDESIPIGAEPVDGQSSPSHSYFAINLISALDRALGLAPTGPSTFTDWTEFYEFGAGALGCQTPELEQLTHHIFLSAGLEIADCLTAAGRLFVTGDTDDATTADIHAYLDSCEGLGIAPCLLFKRFDVYDDSVFSRLRMAGYDVGIHPHSPTGAVDQYLADFNLLSAKVRDTFGCNPIAFRNHQFQFIPRDVTWRAAVCNQLVFDLNACCWGEGVFIGSPNGVSVPLQAWLSRRPFPLWLVPTVIEDDMYLLQLGYCRGGTREAKISEVTEFLANWIIAGGRDVVANFHPEHVGRENEWLLKAVGQWARSHKVIAPKLSELTASVRTQ